MAQRIHVGHASRLWRQGHRHFQNRVGPTRFAAPVHHDEIADYDGGPARRSAAGLTLQTREIQTGDGPVDMSLSLDSLRHGTRSE